MLAVDSQRVKKVAVVNLETGIDGGKVPRLERIAADHGYRTSFIEHVEGTYGWEVEIRQKPESAKGFVPEKNRWPVERSFGWLNFRRRLAKEYEKTVESAEAMLQIAFISFLLNRIKPSKTKN